MLFQFDSISLIFLILYILFLILFFVFWKKRVKKIQWTVLSTMIFLLFAGFWAANWRGQITDSDLRNKLQRQAIAVARTINQERVKTLSFSENDKSNPSFLQMREQMICYEKSIKSNFETSFLAIYSMILKDSAIFFGPESIKEDDPRASKPGTEYKEPPPGLRELFKNGKAITVGPYKDEYSNFVSSFAPVFDPRTGEVLLVVGLDIESSEWEAAIIKQRAIAFSCVMIMVVLLLIGTYLQTVRKRLADRNLLILKYLEAYTVFGFGIIFTIIVAIGLYDFETRNKFDVFTQIAEPEAKSLVKAFRNMRDYQLGGIARYFEGNKNLSRTEFQNLIAPMIRMSGLQAVMGWIIPVAYDEKKFFEEKAHKDGLENFKIWEKDNKGNKIPVKERKIYYVLWYAEPSKGNEEFLGFDVGSDSLNLAALVSAEKTKLPSASPPKFSVNKNEKLSEIYAFHPIFNSVNGNANLSGFVIAILKMESFLVKALTTVRSEYELTNINLYQLNATDNPKFLASTLSTETEEHFLKSNNDLEAGKLRSMHPVFVFGKAYLIVMSPSSGSFAETTSISAILASIIGILVTSLFTAFTVFLSRRHSDLEAMVNKRTSDLKKSEADLIRSKEMAEAASNAKSDFLANMSHEIRTPLNGVIGFTELLLNTKMDQLQKQYAHNANISAHSLLGIINDILDFSKIEAGKLELEDIKVDLNDLLKQTIDIVNFPAHEKGLKLLLNISHSVPKNITIDPVRLRQVLINLLSNAVKFTNEGEIELSADFKPAESKGIGEFTFAVKDTGIGIREEDMNKLFKSFSQADNSTTRKFGGTGLGLVISSRLVEKMRSTINLQSKIGEGTKFYFTLKAKYDNIEFENDDSGIQNKGKHTIEPEKNIEKVSGLYGKTAEILLVDDIPLNLQLVKSMIAEIMPKAVLIESMDGNEAIEKFNEKIPDIIFMDIQMPGKDGYTATREIRMLEENRDIRTPIIALTAGAIKGEKEKCLQAGMDDYLSKPVSFNDLKEKLEFFLFGKISEDPKKSKLEIPGKINDHFDKDELLERIGGNEKLLKELVEISFGQFEKLIVTLGYAVAEKNIEKIKSAAHTIKGASSGVCFNILTSLAKSIEMLNESEMNSADNYLAKIREEWEIVKNILSKNLS